MALTRIKTDQVLDGTITNDDLASDIALNTSGNITTSGDVSAANITMTGELNGPATFYIDPSPHDPDTDGSTNGLVVIRGDLQIDGTTTTVNSTTMDVADLNITLASGAANAAAADGAGLTVDGASATILYDGTNDEWDFNKDIHVDTILTDTGIVHAGDTDTYIKFLSNRIYSDVGGNRILDAQAGDVKINGPDGSAGIAIDTGGYVGIGGVTNPTRNLHVETADAIPLRIEGESDGAISYSEFVNASTSDVGNGVGIEFRALTTTQERQLFYVQSSWSDNTDADRESLTRIFTSGGGSQKNPLTIVGDKVGIGTGANTPDTLLHISATSPHIDIGPKGGNRGKIGYHDLDVIIGSTSSTGEIIFKNNIGSTDSPQDSGDVKMVIGDTNVGIGVETPESRLTVGANAITTLKPTAVFVDGNNGGSVTIRGLSPTLAFDKTGADASARILLDGGALQFRDGNLDATDPNQSNPVTSSLLMVLSHDGKLGIGNFGDGNTAPYYIDPSYQLHVKGDGDIKIEDDTGGSAHLRIASSTSGTRDSEWKVKVSGPADEFHIDHDYTAGGVVDGTTALKISGVTHSLYNDNDQPIVKPTLNFDFANTKTLDPRVIFYRDSIATYYDKNGMLRFASENEPRFDHFGNTGLGNAAHECKGLLIEESRSNEVTDLLSYFNDVEYSSIITKNAGVSPDGKYNAYKFTIDDSTTAAGIRKLYRFGLNTSSFHSISVFVKNIDATTARVNWGDNGQTGSVQASLTFSTGELAVTGASSWLPEGTLDVLANGWYRIKLAFYLPAGASTTTVPHITITGSAHESVLVYGAQIEVNTNSLATSSYIPNEQTNRYFRTRASRATYHGENGEFLSAPVDSPRYGYKYNGRRWIETGLLLEGSATNTIHQNSIPSGAYQSTNSYSKTAPDGTNDAFQNIPTSGRPIGGAACVIWSATAFSNTTDQHTISIYAKGINGFDRIRLYDNTNNKNAYFNLTDAGSFDTVNCDAAHIEYVGDDWYRCGITYVPSVNTSPYFQVYNGNVGDGSGGYQFWGAQAETGTEMSSYIYTTSADVTRAADVAVSNLALTRAEDVAYIELEDDWWNYEEGTFYTHLINDGGNPRLMYASNDTSNQRMGIYVSSASNVRFLISDNGTSVDTTSVAEYGSVGDEVRVAAGFANADVAVSDNGAAPITSTSASITIPQNMTKLYLGGYYNGVPEGSSHLKKFSYYAEKLTDDQLRALTEND